MSMSILLPPELVAAGLAALNDEQTERIGAIPEPKNEHDAEILRYLAAVSEFLLTEIGFAKLLDLYRRYPDALRDDALYARRQ